MQLRPFVAWSSAVCLAAAIGIAGCSGGGASAPPPTVAASLPRLGGSPSASGATVIGPYSPGVGDQTSPPASTSTARPSAGTGLTTTAAPTQPFHLAPDLEGRLPTSAGGKTLTVESVRADGFRDANGRHPIGLRCRWYEGRGLRCRDHGQLATALGAIGRSAGDVAIAVGYNETKNQEIEVQATQVAGGDGAKLRDAVLKVLADEAAKGGDTLTSETSTVGGKSVTVITNASPYPLGLRRWLYASGDTLYDVRRAYDTEAAEILAALP